MYVVGNWKMNQTLDSIKEFFIKVESLKFPLTCECWIAPQACHFAIVQQLAFTLGKIQVGAQNCHYEKKGAFTGETSPEALADIGAHFVIIGHSERRHLMGETDEVIAKKVRAVLNEKMKVILCVGETLAQRESDETYKILEGQLFKGLEGLSDFTDVLVAYEPVWAIGTGKNARPDQVLEVHDFLKKLMEQKFGTTAPVLYGGSVTPENSRELLSLPSVNGILVGGASLKAPSYLDLCMTASQR